MDGKAFIKTGVLGFIALAFASCAPTKVSVVDETTKHMPMPHRVLVYNFAVSPDEVDLDRGVIIGLGVGRSDIKTYVDVFYGLSGGSPKIAEFETDAKSGFKPGAAETMGAGAAAGHLGTAAAVGGALAIGSEAFTADVDADARRTAKKIAKQLQGFFIAQGWMPPDVGQ